ncbi:MAG: methionyl-tRNA formyltransferase [Solirubrobacteraceae bacterium]|jgi:methionyl-tRNA formyltransferase|nr:methionyl-tRNA formyltransferase [Solirubrobacteraceae bacterium]
MGRRRPGDGRREQSIATVFIGTSPFAVTVLESLAGTPHRPSLVITRPDRPRGRGRRPAAPPVGVAAAEHGIDLLQPERLGDVADEVASAQPAIVVVCAYGALVREPLVSTYEILNVHPSLLPRWRGAAPIERAIIAGDTTTGVSIMRLTAGLDSGPICRQEAEPIADDDTYGTLSERLARLSSRLLIGALDGPRSYVEQPDAGVTYAEKITPADRTLDPETTPTELARRVRALHPHIGARIDVPSLAGGLGVQEARVFAGDGGSGAAAGGAGGPPAGGLGVKDGRLLFGASGGALELLRVQPAGRRPMSASDYLRGHAV